MEHWDFQDEILKELYNTAFEADIPIMSDDKCCQILAWLSEYGGGCEAVTVDVRLHNAILYAQKRMNAFGGERPNADLVPLFQKYVREIERSYKNPPDWVLTLEKQYNVNIKMR